MSNSISNTDDMIDSREIIEQIENLEGDLQSAYDGEFEDQQEAWDEWLNDRDSEPADEPSRPPTFGVWIAVQADDVDALMRDEAKEYLALKDLESQCEGYGDWRYGAQLIREGYFTEYAEELIDDCYQLPKELTSGDWPYRHITVDYEAAAEELKSDYMEADFDGNTYLIRA